MNILNTCQCVSMCVCVDVDVLVRRFIAQNFCATYSLEIGSNSRDVNVGFIDLTRAFDVL